VAEHEEEGGGDDRRRLCAQHRRQEPDVGKTNGELLGRPAPLGSDEDRGSGQVGGAAAGLGEDEARAVPRHQLGEPDRLVDDGQPEGAALHGRLAGDQAPPGQVPGGARLVPSDDASGRDQRDDPVDAELGELLDRPFGAAAPPPSPRPPRRRRHRGAMRRHRRPG
jgi:hypothetical protein